MKTRYYISAILALTLLSLVLLGCATPQDSLVPPSETTSVSTYPKANVVICVIDAARADHFGAYGYTRETTPNFDRLAAESLLFENHFAQASFTKGSTASLFTSQHPPTHTVISNLNNPGLDASAYTIAQAFSDAGLESVLFSSNPWVSDEVGMTAGFDKTYTLKDTAPLLKEKQHKWSPEPLITLFSDWLKDNSNSQFFAYIHFIPPHDPYEQPEEFTAFFADQTPPGYQEGNYHPGLYEFPIGKGCRQHPPLPKWINLYDANLRYGDDAVGRIEQALRNSGLFDNTIFIITSDHGSAFGEHGYVYHGSSKNREVAHIPLLIHLPGSTESKRFTALTQSIDLFPTLCELIAIDFSHDELQGKSLLPLLRGETDCLHDYVFTYCKAQNPKSFPLDDFDKYQIRTLDYALFLYGNGLWRGLYDLQADPNETTNILQDNPEITQKMLQVFQDFAAQQHLSMASFLDPTIINSTGLDSITTRDVLTPEQKEALRSLGYLK